MAAGCAGRRQHSARHTPSGAGHTRAGLAGGCRPAKKANASRVKLPHPMEDALRIRERWDLDDNFTSTSIQNNYFTSAPTQVPRTAAIQAISTQVPRTAAIHVSNVILRFLQLCRRLLPSNVLRIKTQSRNQPSWDSDRLAPREQACARMA
jgi:hypothetical protein